MLDVGGPPAQPLVHLSYSTPVSIDAEDFAELFLMMRCARGTAATRQETRHAEWRAGQTMAFSAGFETQLRFDRDFAQTSVRLDLRRLEALCARWLGRPLEAPLRFALTPFAPPLEQTWDQVLSFLAGAGGVPERIGGRAGEAFDEFILTLLLQHHPHNYSDEMRGPAPSPSPRIVHRAERLMAENAAAPLTVSGIAAELGVSVRALQAAFRQWRATTPSAFLRGVRLERVRRELERPEADTSVTAAALRWGFVHLGRFSAYYRAAFHEAPGATLRRRRKIKRAGPGRD